MRERKDILNGKLPQYDTFVNRLYSKATANQAAWNIPASSLAAYLPLLNKWNLKWSVSKLKTKASSVDRTATTSARKNLTKFLRPFIQVHIMRNSELSDADILKCGLQPYKKKKSKSGKPRTAPWMHYVVKSSHNIEAFYRQAAEKKGVTSRGKPLHVAFCKIAYFIGEEPPSEPEDFPRTIITSSNGTAIKFKAADAGKKITFVACWVSTGNIDGNWSKPQSMYIP
jgi:hypothetical protein